MPSQDIVERFKALKELSEKLCAQDSNKTNAAIQARDWLVDQLKVLREMVDLLEEQQHLLEEFPQIMKIG